jgi:uncharacterized protein YecE (DUF72 family)
MTEHPDNVFIGCAGWALRTEQQRLFPERGSHLERYAGRFRCVEINSSFYKPHRPATYRRWRDSTPAGFRFAVKVPKAITHTARLVDAAPLLEQFFSEATALEEKLGPLLVQLPPSLRFEAATVEAFFTELRNRHAGPIVCEPRHKTWFTREAEALLESHRISRVAADPPRAEVDAEPGGDLSVIYYRLHGSPEIYYSAYPDAKLEEVRQTLLRWSPLAEQVWCILDNTAEGHATTNALALQERLRNGS